MWYIGWVQDDSNYTQYILYYRIYRRPYCTVYIVDLTVIQ